MLNSPAEPTRPAEIQAPSPGLNPEPSEHQPRIEVAPSAAAAPTDRAVETPRIEYELLEAPSGAAVAPALPIYQPPSLTSRTEPTYPTEALARKESGTIVLRLLISESGIVERGVIEAGIPGSALETAAVTAAMSWTYEPAKQSGRPIRAWITERVVFAP